MRDRIQTLADELLAEIERKGECDLINTYALPLPMIIITEILGVPTHDRDKFHKWSKAVVSLTSPSPTIRVIPMVWKFLRYLRRFFEIRRRNPQDDLATALITAEQAGDKLNKDELLAMVFLLLIAGHETTVNLPGCPLARLEAEIAINTLLRRIPDFRLSVPSSSLRWRPSIFLRGLDSLPFSTTKSEDV